MTAASDKRISGALSIMQLNKELVERTMSGIGKIADGIKVDVGEIKEGVENSMSGVK